MLKTIYIFISLLAFFTAAAQQRIRGKVLSASSRLAIEGVTVRIKGGESSATNATGEFSLNAAKPSPVLLFSHTGYRSLEVVADSNRIYFLEENAVSLQEVTVSTGYQEIKSRNSTGSFDKINQEAYNRTVSPDVLSRLEGIAPGAFFSKVNGTNEIFIRGISTISAGTAPLIVLDNFPYEGNILNINPNDVESVTILKDAAAAAIWGAKAGNGVIVITTKKGKYGQRSRLNVKAGITFQQAPDLRYSPSFLASPEFIEVEKFLFSKGYYDGDLSNTTNRPVISPVVELLNRVRSGQLTQAAADDLINAYALRDVRDEQRKYFYRTGMLREYATSLSGGSGVIHYMLSGGHDNNLAASRGGSYQRSTFSSKTTLKLFSRLEAEASLQYTYSKTLSNSIGNIIPEGKSMLYPYAAFADMEGKPLALAYGYRSAYLDTAGGGLLLDWRYRPLDELKLKDNKTVLQDILIRFGLTYAFSKKFSAVIKLQMEKASDNKRVYYSPESYFTRNFINRFSQRAGSGIKQNIPYGGILDNSGDELAAFSGRGQLTYDNQWKKHALNIIAGSEIRHKQNTGLDTRLYGYNNNILTSAGVDYVSSFMLYGSLGSGSIPNPAGLSETVNRFLSFYSNAVYTFKDRYTFSASARKDASNLFGVSTNNRWTPLWSAGVSWNVSEEAFYAIKAVPVVKLRLTYGYNGNVRNNLSAVPVIRYFNPNAATNLPFAQATTLPNPKLRWEKTAMVNAGIDLQTADRRLTFTAEYYHKNSIDLLGPAGIDPTLGLSTMIINTANVTGKGVDVKLNAILADGAVKWYADLLFSYVTNRVKKYFPASTNKGAYAGYSTNIVPLEGYDPYALISFRWAGLDPLTGDPLGYINGTQSKDYAKLVSPLSFDDLVIKGTTRPPYFASLVQTLAWKGFRLSVAVNGKFGYYFRRTPLSYSALYSGWVGNKAFSDRWQQPGDELITSVPSMVYPANQNRDIFYGYSEATVEKGDVIRLQNIALNYSPAFKKEGFLKNASLSLFINNPGILWRANKYGIDPDYGSLMPAQRSLSLGFTATF